MGARGGGWRIFFLYLFSNNFIIVLQGLSHIFANCPYVEKLDLSYSEVTDRGLTELADRYNARLTSISLLQCINITRHIV